MEDYLRDSPFDDSNENSRLNPLSAQLDKFEFDAEPNVFPPGNDSELYVDGNFPNQGQLANNERLESLIGNDFGGNNLDSSNFGLNHIGSKQAGRQSGTNYETQFGNNQSANYDNNYDANYGTNYGTDNLGGNFDQENNNQFNSNQFLNEDIQFQPESQFPTTRDPYAQTFDFLGSPTQQNRRLDLHALSDGAGDFCLSSSFQDPKFGDAVTSLDQLVSPEVQSNLDMFALPTYFLPNLRNYNSLNAITENSPGTLNDAFSPNVRSPARLRHGSISVGTDAFLSLRAFRSPVMGPHETDTLSPYGLYLNSPPPAQVVPSTSIPTAPFKPATVSAALSPPPATLGVSAPTVRQADLSSGMTPEEKAKRRREFHNAVERRRRDLIKEKIKELGVLVPPLLLTPEMCAVQVLLKQATVSKETQELIAAAKAKDTKPNKAVILHASVDYIRHLGYVLEQQKARRAELEDSIAQVESRVGSKSLEMSSTSAADSALAPAEFNPDEFFSDVLGDGLQY